MDKRLNKKGKEQLKKELNEKLTQFTPEGQGYHGPRALWINQEGGEEYWEAILNFLNSL